MPAIKTSSGKGLPRMSATARDVLEAINEYAMLQPGHRVAVACSGGADSTALLLLLLELSEQCGWLVSVAHFNHQLRGADSDHDEQFVRELASTRGLAFFSHSAQVRQSATAGGSNLEATAREYRYAFLRSLVSTGLVDRVAVGHTANDQAETVLLRLIRGSGARGLGAIRPVLPHGIIRPLIHLRGTQLRQWLAAKGVRWREDASNTDRRFRRNHLRHDILPVLERMNPAIVRTLSQTAQLAQVDEPFWKSYVSYLAGKYATRHNGAVEIDRTALRRLPRAASYRLLQWALEVAGRPAAEAESSTQGLQRSGQTSFLQVKNLHAWAVLDRRVTGQPPGRRKTLALPANLEAKLSSGHLSISIAKSKAEGGSPTTDSYSHTVRSPGGILLAEAGLAVRFEIVAVRGKTEAYNKNGCSLLDWSKLSFPMLLRNWRPGDAYCPVGRHKSRKLKELFQRQKVPVAMRKTWPVLESGGRIVWSREFGPASDLFPPMTSEALLITLSAAGASNNRARERK